MDIPPVLRNEHQASGDVLSVDSECTLRDLMLRFTGKIMTTITSSPLVCVSDTGKQYYAKRTSESEYKQIRLLESLQLPVPASALFANDMLITPDAGHPLSSVLPENAASSYRKAGNLLRHMHTTFKHATGAIPQELLSISTKDSGHPVQNFCHRFIERKSNATNAFCSHEIPFQFPMLHRLQESIANILQDMRQKCSAIDCQQEDNDIIFGDYKPDNILISKLGELCLIDPDIRRGKECFDIAKFVSRVLLEGETAFPLLTEFSAGYGHIEPSELHYGNLEFKEQVLLDLINILSAYLGRWILGQRSFRLVQQLSDEQYCNYLVRLVTTLSSCSEDLSPSPIEIAVLSVSHA